MYLPPMKTLGRVNLDLSEWPRIFCSSSMNLESIIRSRSSIATRSPRRINRTVLQSSKVRRTIRKLVKYTTTVFSAPGIRISGSASSGGVSFCGSVGCDRERTRDLTLRLRWQMGGFEGESKPSPGLRPPLISPERRACTSLKEEQANLGRGALWTRALVLDRLSHMGSEFNPTGQHQKSQFTNIFTEINENFQIDRVRWVFLVLSIFFLFFNFSGKGQCGFVGRWGQWRKKQEKRWRVWVWRVVLAEGVSFYPHRFFTFFFASALVLLFPFRRKLTEPGSGQTRVAPFHFCGAGYVRSGASCLI